MDQKIKVFTNNRIFSGRLICIDYSGNLLLQGAFGNFLIPSSPLEIISVPVDAPNATVVDVNVQADRWMGLIMIPGESWTRVFLVSDAAYVTA
jgi:hypothetical protein